jgi:hypothetical protein
MLIRFPLKLLVLREGQFYLSESPAISFKEVVAVMPQSKLRRLDTNTSQTSAIVQEDFHLLKDSAQTRSSMRLLRR